MNEDVLHLDFKLPPEEHEVRQETIACRGFVATFSALALPVEYSFKATNPNNHYLALHDLILRDGEMSVDGKPPIRGGDLRGRMTFIPSGHSFEGWSRPVERNNSFTALSYDPELLSQEMEGEAFPGNGKPQIYFKNERLTATMLKMENILKKDASHSKLYIETLGLVAMLEMMLAGVVEENAKIFRRGGLSPMHQSLLENYIHENLVKDITLDELAGIANMSRFHFSRSFKESFGEAPIRYINRKRFEFSKSLLVQTRFPIASIARQAGFGSAQRFIMVFREFSGVTPAEFRRQCQ